MDIHEPEPTEPTRRRIVYTHPDIDGLVATVAENITWSDSVCRQYAAHDLRDRIGTVDDVNDIEIVELSRVYDVDEVDR